ncbi:MAG: hypothetical protein JO359_06135 [Candidatus Eremiobacteraeota bacterium]|nr:hypothetical protein [Candidatus Eremiobacteraeota bacterium]
MDGIGPAQTTLINAALGVQAEFAQTAAALSSGLGRDLVSGVGDPQLSFYDYLTAASAAYDRGTAAAQAAQPQTVSQEAAAGEIASVQQEIGNLTIAANNGLLDPTTQQILALQINAETQQIAPIANAAGLNANASTTLQSGAFPSSTTQLNTFDLRSAPFSTVVVDQAQLGIQADELQNAVNYNDNVSTGLTGIASGIAETDRVRAIETFREQDLSHRADLFALARADNQDGITLGMLDAQA